MPKTNKNRERKSKKGPDRLEYLSQLKSEFEESRSEDPPFKTFFLENGVMEAIFSNLSTPRIGITINSLCAFIFLFDVNYPNYFSDARFISMMVKFRESPLVQIRNLAEAFVSEFCTADQIQASLSVSPIVEIPVLDSTSGESVQPNTTG
ncbi:hypothetical protein QYM36_002495 [Artemia franciscana]|uniref:Uncharacterized protein n=1 Tax=Artemia franciscana TaxID=6661 RepID=A0AA88LEN0_ARTSF|nr:hypothetical protein QYM36_002495 [Artemia franciscana]KAK2721950.1 hypothetical protein QYM36_002495 [Artemia franciscana]